MLNKSKIKLLPSSFSPWKPAKEPSRQIAVLMSGGVDSSVTANILKQAGWEVLGITMKVPVACDTKKRGCCGADAAFVCNELNIPHYFIDVTEPFDKLIIERFREAYSKGQTPNPCADCNTYLKFSLVWDFLEETFGIKYLATGHYARIIQIENQSHLVRAKDKTKDQSYFLYGIDSKKLPKLVLPLGDMSKSEIRSTARQLGLSVAEKSESMELCFAGEDDYRTALAENQLNQTGNMTDMQGNVIGTHKGIANYTLGQRRGIGFAAGSPVYVGKIDAKKNTIALGTRDEISFHNIAASQINLLIPEQLVPGKVLFGKIRSYGNPDPCTVINRGDNEITVKFDKPQFAPSIGQKLVLYNHDEQIVAGGTIVNSF